VPCGKPDTGLACRLRAINLRHADTIRYTDRYTDGHADSYCDRYVYANGLTDEYADPGL
jgi:hypothetical protein